MAIEYDYCPNCDVDRSDDKNNHRIPVRECSNCGKHHCGECSKHLDVYKCVHCNSPNIKLVGYFFNRNYNT